MKRYKNNPFGPSMLSWVLGSAMMLAASSAFAAVPDHVSGDGFGKNLYLTGLYPQTQEPPGTISNDDVRFDDSGIDAGDFVVPDVPEEDMPYDISHQPEPTPGTISNDDVRFDDSGIDAGDDTAEAQADSCPEDCRNDDGMVDTVDLLELLSEWGTPGPHDCDIAGFGRPIDRSVGVADLLCLLTAWGACP